MAITRLKRKGKRNKVRSKVRQVNIQRLNATPVIKSVDVEAIKEEFAKGGKKAEAKNEAPKVEVAEEKAPKAEKKEATPKAEKKEAEPKAEKKKAAPKKKAEDN